MVDVLFCATHAAKEVILHLYRQKRKRPTLVRRCLSQTQAVLRRVVLGVWMPVSGMKMSVKRRVKCKLRNLDINNLQSKLLKQGIPYCRD